MALSITSVTSSGELKRFIELPYRLHRGNPAFVPPLIADTKVTLDPKKNPFFEHATVELFIARQNSKVVGRIAAIVDQNYIQVRGEPVGLFGFFECVDDPLVARALFDAAAQSLKARGMKVMLGPTNPSMNDEVGVLVDAFDLPPVIKMVWNPSYYPVLFESAGFRKAKDLWAWTMSRDEVSERLLKFGEIILKRAKVTFRHVNMKQFDQEIEIFRGVYNQAWSNNWGFVPWTKHEFEHVAKSLKQVIDPELVWVAEDNGRPVAFSLALPDLNLALKHINGRLFPFGLPLLLWHARKVHSIRVVILGVLGEYRNRGLDTALYYLTYKSGSAKGYNRVEMSWILEDNTQMNRAAEMMGGHKYKTYRVYERDLV